MFLSWLCLANYLASALAEFYIQFRLDRDKSLVRKILGNDYYDQPEWRIYLCRDFKDRYHHGNPGDHQPLAFTNDSAVVVKCSRFRLGWPKFFRRATFYTKTNFYQTHRALDSGGVHYEFSDMRRGEVPVGLWFGSEHAFQYPQFYRTPEMLEFFREASEDWLSIVPNLAMQQNLIGYLSMPDLTWAYGSANVTAAYLRAYVAYLSVVVTEYDAYMFVQDQPMKIPDVPLDWRGPAWLDWKIMKPAKKFYNANRRKTDKMHGLWLLDPSLESQLRKMIPVLMSKMIDPCFLQDAASYFPNKVVFRNEEFLGQPEDMLCSIYCRFSNAVTKLYRDSGSDVCYLMNAGNKRYGGQCRGDRCYCLRKIESKKKDYTLSATLRYCVNVFNMQQYNDTHTCRPEI